MASFCFYRHTPQLSLILPSALPPLPPSLPDFSYMALSLMAGGRIDPLPSVNLVLYIWVGSVWIGLERSKQKRDGLAVYCICLLKCSKGCLLRRFVYDFVCVCVWKCVCMLCLYCIQEWERQKDEVRSEEKRGRERATAGIPSCPGWSHSHSGRPPAPRHVRPAHLPHG